MGWFDWLTPARPVLDALPVVDHEARAVEVARLDATVNALTRLGEAGIDKGASARPASRLRLTDEECADVYRHNGYMRRAIEIRAGDATRTGWVVAVEGQDGDPLVSEWKRLHVGARMRQALALASVYGGAIIVMVTDDVPKEGDSKRPLRAGARVLALQVLDRREFEALGIVTNMADPDYRRPRAYQVTPSDTGQSLEVHRSRVLCVPGEPALPSDRSRLRQVDQSWIDVCWEKLANLDQIDSSGAVVAQELKQAILKLDGLANLQSEDASRLLRARVESMMRGRSSLGALIIDGADDFAQQAGAVSGYRELHDAAASAYAAVTGIPQVRLFGYSPAGMSSDDQSAARMWREVVADVQELRLRPALERLAEVMLPGVSGWSLDFNPLDEPTETEWATIEGLHATADSARIMSGVLTPDHVARSRFGASKYGTRILPLSTEDLDAMTEPDEPTDEDLAILRRPVASTEGEGGA